MLLSREIVKVEGIIAKSGKNKIVCLMLVILNSQYYLGRRVKWVVIHMILKSREDSVKDLM